MISTCEDCGAVFEVSRWYFRILMRAMAKGLDSRWRCGGCRAAVAMRTLRGLMREEIAELIEQGEAIGEGEL